LEIKRQPLGRRGGGKKRGTARPVPDRAKREKITYFLRLESLLEIEKKRRRPTSRSCKKIGKSYPSEHKKPPSFLRGKRKDSLSPKGCLPEKKKMVARRTQRNKRKEKRRAFGRKKKRGGAGGCFLGSAKKCPFRSKKLGNAVGKKPAEERRRLTTKMAGKRVRFPGERELRRSWKLRRDKKPPEREDSFL